MSTGTKIGYVDATLNFISGCTKFSLGCFHCFAEETTNCIMHNPKFTKYRAGFNTVVTHPEAFAELAKLKKPCRVLVNDMSDTFHQDVPEAFIRQMFEVMGQHPQHQFLLLTKRSERLAQLGSSLPWGQNIWAGVTVESADYVHRLDHLRCVPAVKRWVSAEPLLSALPNLNLAGIHFLVCGGESGRVSRPMDLDWARDLRDQCHSAGVSFWFKQVGGRDHKHGGDILDGNRYHQYPQIIAAIR